MANITFYLKSSKPDKKGLKPILIQITHNYKRVRIASGEKIKPAYWNKKKQRAFETKDFANESDYVRINNFLDDIEAKFKKLVSNAKLKDIELTDEFLKNNLFKGEAGGKKTLFEIFDEYIDSNRTNRSRSTLAGYSGVKHFLQAFEKDTKNYISLGSIDLILFDKLKDYAFSERKITDNYFAKIIKTIKAVLNWAKDRAYYTGETYKKFKALETEKEVIYLRIDELIKLHNYKFESAKLQNARDLFCFSCFTGFRISDTISLKRENINLQSGLIVKTIQKTKRIESIPLNTYALEILKKHENSPNPLPRVSSDMLNTYIKACCKEAGIEETVSYTRYSGNVKTIITKPKHELVTSHTARKTFVTNSLILHMNVKTIKSITGHKLDSTFERYLMIAEDFKQLEMDNTWNKLNKVEKASEFKTGMTFNANVPQLKQSSVAVVIDHVLPSKNEGQNLLIFSVVNDKDKNYQELMCSDIEMSSYIKKANPQ